MSSLSVIVFPIFLIVIYFYRCSVLEINHKTMHFSKITIYKTLMSFIHINKVNKKNEKRRNRNIKLIFWNELPVVAYIYSSLGIAEAMAAADTLFASICHARVLLWLEWRFTCFVKWSLRMNLRSHTGQANFFSPVCVLL